MSWDAFQREALAELGLQPWVPAATERAQPATRAAPAHQESSDMRSAVPPALMDALARAAGCDRARVAALPGVEGACAGAAGKRALWPRLRRLRAELR